MTQEKERLFIERDKLRVEFRHKTGDPWLNSQNEPDIDYVEWLENKIITTLTAQIEAEAEGKGKREVIFQCDSCGNMWSFLNNFCPKCQHPHFSTFVKSQESESHSYQPNVTERFKMPTDKQLVEIALLFNDGKLQKTKLRDMVAMAEFIVDRLYENGNCMIKSSKED